MKYRLPDKTVVDLGDYKLDDCEEINSENIVISQKEMFNRTGILVAATEEGFE